MAERNLVNKFILMPSQIVPSLREVAGVAIQFVILSKAKNLEDLWLRPIRFAQGDNNADWIATLRSQ
jgi:hypothetical protein